MGIEAWSTTAASNNAATPNGWPEGQAPSTVNDCARQMMASIRAWFEDAQWTNLNHTPTRIDNDTFTVATDLTATYHTGRRLKLTGSATGYCTIASSSYGAPNTTINVTMDSGNIPATLSAVYLSILSYTNHAVPEVITAAQILAKLLTVDGAGSGLDADTLDGSSSAAFAAASHNHAASETTSGTFADARIAQSNVTQHQAALSIGGGQVSSAVANATNATTATNSTQLGGVAAASYALLASPALTGTPTAPSASVGTNTTAIATTAFVQDSTPGGDGNYADVTGSRSAGTPYTNSTGKPMFVNVRIDFGASGSASFIVDSVEIARCQDNGSNSSIHMMSAIVPRGSDYQVDLSGGASLTLWVEL